MREIEALISTLTTKYIPTGKSAVDLQDVVRGYLRLKPEQDAINYKDPRLVCDMLKLKVQKYRKQTMPITSVYADLAKEIIECLGLAWYQATGEAEALCSYMAINGQVDGVLTEDTDVLAYGTPILFSKIDMRANTVMMIETKSMLQELEMDMLQFRDLCILLGCDYNKRAKMHPPKRSKAKGPIAIGPKKAIDLIRDHKSIDKMIPFLVDPSVLNVKRCRELFTPPRSFTLEREPFNRPIDTKRTEEFLLRNECSVTIQYILEAWRPTDLVYVGRDEEASGDSEAEVDESDGEAEVDSSGDGEADESDGEAEVDDE
jgi:flap endonuclease-1